MQEARSSHASKKPLHVLPGRIGLACLGLGYLLPASIALIHWAQFNSDVSFRSLKSMIAFLSPIGGLLTVLFLLSSLCHLVVAWRLYQIRIRAEEIRDDSEKKKLKQALLVQQIASAANLVMGVVIWWIWPDTPLVVNAWLDERKIEIPREPTACLWCTASLLLVVFANVEWNRSNARLSYP